MSLKKVRHFESETKIFLDVTELGKRGLATAPPPPRANVIELSTAVSYAFLGICP